MAITAKIRALCFERDQLCQQCDSTEHLQVHHQDGSGCRFPQDRNDNLDNLILLCCSCHRKQHGGPNSRRRNQSISSNDTEAPVDVAFAKRTQQYRRTAEILKQLLPKPHIA